MTASRFRLCSCLISCADPGTFSSNQSTSKGEERYSKCRYDEENLLSNTRICRIYYFMI
ncbi:hypothetical protein MHYP_G00318510 [Metynnis hypsauchen]